MPVDNGLLEAARAADGFEPALSVVEQRLEQGAIAPSELPSPYNRYTADRLVELARMAPTGAADHRWTHGRPTVDRFLVAGGQFVAFAGSCRAGIADRHLDVAVTQLGVAAVLGAEGVIAFHAAYDQPVDVVQLDRALLMVLLAGWGP